MQIRRAKLVYLAPLRCAATMAAVALVVAIPIAAVAQFFKSFDQVTRPVYPLWWAYALILLVVWVFLAFVCTLFACWTFNLVARVFGGVPYRTVVLEPEASANEDSSAEESS